MAITYIDITLEPAPSRCTRSELAPVDSRIANEALRKIPNYRNADENYRNAKRGRPVTGEAMSNAERQRRYRERKKRAAAS